MAPTDTSGARRSNRLIILQLVRRHTPITRAAIAKQSGISKPAVTTIVQRLLEDGIVVEDQRARMGAYPDASRETPETGTAPGPAGREAGPSLGLVPVAHTAAARPAQTVAVGRPGIGLSLNPDFAAAIGVEIADAAFDVVRVDLSGRILARTRRPFRPDGSVSGIVGDLVLAVQDVVLPRSGSPAATTIRGVGIAVPGLVDWEQGISLSIPGLPHWHEVPLRERVAQALGLPVWLDHRAFAATLAERWYGAAREASDFVYVNASDGISAGIVVAGQLLRGRHAMAGGLGHLPVEPAARAGGRTCVCGNTGCLQTVASIPAIIHRVEQALDDGVDSVLTQRASPDRPTLSYDQLLAAARAGDKPSLDALEDAGDSLGRAVASVLNLLDTPLVIIGGGITRAGDYVFQALLRAARRYARQRAFDGVKIVLSHLQPGAALVGAATMVLEAVLAEAGGGRLGAVA